MTQFADDNEFFGAGPAGGTAAAVPGATTLGTGDYHLNLTDDDLFDGQYPDIPVGTWLRVGIYEVIPAMVKSEKNYGKPKYTFVLRTQQESYGWGERRKFNIFANLFQGAFFTAYGILKAVGKAPTKETLAKGAFFPASKSAEYPPDLAHIFTEDEKIPNGAYIFPAPSQLVGLELYGKVTGHREYRNKMYPEIEKFASVDEYKAALLRHQQSTNVFKGPQ